MLLESKYEDSGMGMEEEQLIDECLILFVAGHETSANALSWMIYLLGKHKEELLRIQTAEAGLEINMIHNVVQEALRLYPPAWVSDRISLEDDRVEDFFYQRIRCGFCISVACTVIRITGRNLTGLSLTDGTILISTKKPICLLDPDRECALESILP